MTIHQAFQLKCLVCESETFNSGMAYKLRNRRLFTRALDKPQRLFLTDTLIFKILSKKSFDC